MGEVTHLVANSVAESNNYNSSNNNLKSTASNSIINSKESSNNNGPNFDYIADAVHRQPLRGRALGYKALKDYSEADLEFCRVASTQENLFVNRLGEDSRFLRVRVLLKLKAQLEKLLFVFETFPRWRLYSSSILIVYDFLRPLESLKIYIIDFAHVFHITIEDQNGEFEKDYKYIFGLRNLIHHVQRMIRRS